MGFLTDTAQAAGALSPVASLISPTAGAITSALGNLGNLFSGKDANKQRIQLMEKQAAINDRYQRNLIADTPFLNRSAMESAGFSTAGMSDMFKASSSNASASAPNIETPTISEPNPLELISAKKDLDLKQSQIDLLHSQKLNTDIDTAKNSFGFELTKNATAQNRASLISYLKKGDGAFRDMFYHKDETGATVFDQTYFDKFTSSLPANIDESYIDSFLNVMLSEKSAKVREAKFRELNSEYLARVKDIQLNSGDSSFVDADVNEPLRSAAKDNATIDNLNSSSKLADSQRQTVDELRPLQKANIRSSTNLNNAQSARNYSEIMLNEARKRNLDASSNQLDALRGTYASVIESNRALAGKLIEEGNNLRVEGKIKSKEYKNWQKRFNSQMKLWATEAAKNLAAQGYLNAAKYKAYADILFNGISTATNSFRNVSNLGGLTDFFSLSNGFSSTPSY